MWKAAFILTLAVIGAFAEIQVSDAQKEQFNAVLKEYCKKNGADDATATNVQDSIKTFVDCVKGLVNVETLKQEIETAKPNGALDEVFHKYCAKSGEFKSCIRSLSSGMVPCMSPKVKEHLGADAINNATEQLIDFVCYKDGDRIAMFIAEDGPQCLQEKANQIRECGEQIKTSVPNQEAAEALNVEQVCAKFNNFTSCTVKALEGCSSPTPGNMVEALLRFVRNGSPCKEKK